MSPRATAFARSHPWIWSAAVVGVVFGLVPAGIARWAGAWPWTVWVYLVAGGLGVPATALFITRRGSRYRVSLWVVAVGAVWALFGALSAGISSGNQHFQAAMNPPGHRPAAPACAASYTLRGAAADTMVATEVPGRSRAYVTVTARFAGGLEGEATNVATKWVDPGRHTTQIRVLAGATPQIDVSVQSPGGTRTCLADQGAQPEAP